jgi:N-acetylglucosaminylphosphatidylinositol deacetylase
MLDPALTLLALALLASIYLWARHANLNLFFLDKLVVGKGKKKILLLTAHPDDEVMFFVPSIRAFKLAGYDIHVVCFSTGNFDGLGSIRSKELEVCSNLLGISSVECLDLPEFPDDSGVFWKEQDVASRISIIVKKLAPDLLLTFDERGVSGHLNHRSLYKGVRFYLESRKGSASVCSDIPAYSLSSISLIRKFTSFLDIFVTFLPALYKFLIGKSDSSNLILISSLSDFFLAQNVFPI